MTSIRFCGAAGTVTGSCSLVQSGDVSFLVDCGLFQGNRTTQDLNYQPFPFDVGQIRFLLLTHAHIDHSGLIPKLVKAGFEGPIFATEATCDLLDFMLPDSAFIQEGNVVRHNKKLKRLGKEPVEAVYTMEHAEFALSLLKTVPYEAWLEPAPGIKVRYWNAGHLLGSSSIEVSIDHDSDPDTRPLRMLFSGDLGPEHKAFHPEPDAPPQYDYVICESTYGDRDREDYTLENRREAIKQELNAALARGGNVIIPSFAVERSQELLHDIGYLLSHGEIPHATVYLDSPLARRATNVFIKHAAMLEDVAMDSADLFRHPNFRLVQTAQESKAINNVRKNAIIISASGMCNAGRIKHHLANNIYKPEATILFVGYQSPGTLGHVITSGAKDVRIFGKPYRVAAQIRRLGNYSAHADQSELLQWIQGRAPVTGGLFLNHGEDGPRQTLKDLLVAQGWDADRILLPAFDEQFDLTTQPVHSEGVQNRRIEPADLQRDWYNDYSTFMLELTRRLESTGDANVRHQIIDRITAALNQTR